MSFLGNDARLSVPKRSPEMKRAREASMTAHTVSVEARRGGTRMEEGDQLVAATCPEDAPSRDSNARRNRPWRRRGKISSMRPWVDLDRRLWRRRDVEDDRWIRWRGW